MLSAYVYPGGGEFGEACAGVAWSLGLEPASSPAGSTVAVAPLLTRILRADDLAGPVVGTLIFHPSALPYRRGRDAVRWAVASGERVSAATWFWADLGVDTGRICEQEVVVLLPGESPGRAYHTRFVPAGLRALARALAGVVAGAPRFVEQDAELATYDPPWVGARGRA